MNYIIISPETTVAAILSIFVGGPVAFFVGVGIGKLFCCIKDKYRGRQEEEPVIAVGISGLSGVGKTRICQELQSMFPQMAISVSETTRAPRCNDTEYNFVSKLEFEEGIQNNKYIEYTSYDGNYYGTPLAPLQDKDILLFNVDATGQESLKDKLAAALGKKVRYISVFLFDDLDEVEKRIRLRATETGETEEMLNKRIRCNQRDIEALFRKEDGKTPYDLIIRNRDIAETAEIIASAIDAAG